MEDWIQGQEETSKEERAVQQPESHEDALRILAAELQRGLPVSVIYSDLDNFKSVNDKLGHIAGDGCVGRFEKLLAEIADGRGKVFRRYATGDEFIVVLPNFSTAEAVAVAERIRVAVEKSEIGGEVSVTASLGVDGSDIGPVGSAEELIHLADQMMYQAKQTKNAVGSPANSARMLGPAELTRSLTQWMRDSMARWETVARDRISGENRALCYAWGTWAIGYAIAATPPRLGLPELLDRLEKMPGQTRCLHPWRVPSGSDKRPYPFGRALECWPTTSPDGFSPEYWRASPELQMFYLRKHEEGRLRRQVRTAETNFPIRRWRHGKVEHPPSVAGSYALRAGNRRPAVAIPCKTSCAARIVFAWIRTVSSTF
jgi:diguanylate cyclase (GGDEF)-like protein